MERSKFISVVSHYEPDGTTVTPSKADNVFGGITAITTALSSIVQLCLGLKKSNEYEQAQSDATKAAVIAAQARTDLASQQEESRKKNIVVVAFVTVAAALVLAITLIRTK